MADETLVSDPIAIYGDGSFSAEAGIGAWAFRVPALNIEGAGSEHGKSVQRFEFLAILEGIEAVVNADKSGLPIHVFSDCNSTVGTVDLLRTGLPLKNPEKYVDRADLIPRLQVALAGREVKVTHYGLCRLEHQACHRNAAAKLRDVITSDPIARHEVVLKKLRSRMAQVVGERGTVLKRLEKLDEDVSVLQTEIEAVEQAIGQIMQKNTKAAPDHLPVAAAGGLECRHNGLSAPANGREAFAVSRGAVSCAEYIPA
jgi:ribonuclease HI